MADHAAKGVPRPEVNKFLKKCETTFPGGRSRRPQRTMRLGADRGASQERHRRAIARLQGIRMQSSCSLRCASAMKWRRGRLDKAARTLQTGFAWRARRRETHASLVPRRNSRRAWLMEKRLEEFIQQPNAPNLYWSLTDLPRPFIDLRKAMQGERVGVYGIFPAWPRRPPTSTPSRSRRNRSNRRYSIFSEMITMTCCEVNRQGAAGPRPGATARGGEENPHRPGSAERVGRCHAALSKSVCWLGCSSYDQILDEYMKLETLPYNEGQRADRKMAQKRINEQFKRR